MTCCCLGAGACHSITLEHVSGALSRRRRCWRSVTRHQLPTIRASCLALCRVEANAERSVALEHILDVLLCV